MLEQENLTVCINEFTWSQQTCLFDDFCLIINFISHHSILILKKKKKTLFTEFLFSVCFSIFNFSLLELTMFTCFQVKSTLPHWLRYYHTCYEAWHHTWHDLPRNCPAAQLNNKQQATCLKKKQITWAVVNHFKQHISSVMSAVTL